MIIKINDPLIGTLTWELPPDLAKKWDSETAKMSEEDKADLRKFIEDSLTHFLSVVCDALEFTPATPALWDVIEININNLTSNANDVITIVQNLDKALDLIKGKVEDPEMKEIDEILNEDKDGEDDDDDLDDSGGSDDDSPGEQPSKPA